MSDFDETKPCQTLFIVMRLQRWESLEVTTPWGQFPMAAPHPTYAGILQVYTTLEAATAAADGYPIGQIMTIPKPT